MREKEKKMADPIENAKKSLLHWENVQNLAIILAMILGIRQKPQSGSPEESRIPDWVMNLLPESLTFEDEAWLLLIQACGSDEAIVAEIDFRRRFQEDPRDYDPGEYRKRLMHLKKEFLEQSGKHTIKNEPAGRTDFEKVTFRDPCNIFLKRLVAEVAAAGTPEEIYERQRKFAVTQNLLVVRSGLKKTGRWIRTHKPETIVGLILMPVAIFELLMLLLG